MVQCISSEQTQNAFLANAPLIATTIRNMELQAPNWYRDLLKPEPWPDGAGLSMQELEYNGELPQAEEGFGTWELLDDPSGCGPICTPNCGYNFYPLEGNAFTSKTTRIMRKDFRTPNFCVTSISSTRDFQQIFSAMVQGFYNQIAFHKEVNVGQNFMSQISLKYMVDSAGFKPNSGDPFSYLPKGDTVLSSPTMELMEFFYQQIRMIPNIEPYGYSNNMPLYAAVASPELLTSIYRDDPRIRTDLRYAAAGSEAYGNDLIQRYNLNYTLRDMFLPISYLTPRRFYWSDTLGWVRVLPWIKGVKGTVGTFTSINPQYMDPTYATHEEMLIHGMNPMGVYTRQEPTTLGENSSFGPQPGNGFWDNFQWSNPETPEDPGRLVGFYWTRAQIALTARSTSFAIMWPRRPMTSAVRFYDPNMIDPPAATAASTNVVAASGCPEPTISYFAPSLVTGGNYFVTFTVPLDAEEDDVLLLESTSGGFVSATVITASEDGKSFEVEIAGDVSSCPRYFRLWNINDMACSSQVASYETVSGDATQLNLLLKTPIRAYQNGQAILLKYGNGTTQTGTVVSAGVDVTTNMWRVDIGATAFTDNVNGIVEICVPTSTVASCPGCAGPLEEQCET